MSTYIFFSFYYSFWNHHRSSSYTCCQMHSACQGWASFLWFCSILSSSFCCVYKFFLSLFCCCSSKQGFGPNIILYGHQQVCSEFTHSSLSHMHAHTHAQGCVFLMWMLGIQFVCGLLKLNTLIFCFLFPCLLFFLDVSCHIACTWQRSACSIVRLL